MAQGRFPVMLLISQGGEEEAGPPAETPRSGMQCCRREDWREVAGKESEPAGRGSGAGSPGRPKFTITTVT